jgi:NitT/TauT family transport system substrate-binding protein
MGRRFLSAVLTPLVAIASVTGLAACGDDSIASPNEPVTLRLGHFPNLTHATPIVGVEKGIFKEKLGSNVTLEIKTFNAGPEAVEALLSGALDATYIGPNRRRVRVRWRRVHRQAQHHQARGPQGQEDRHPAAR